MLKDSFSLLLVEYSAEDLYTLAIRVQPSFIRVGANEVTYPLHAILRFEIEEAIIESNLRALNLLKLWNSKI